MKKALEFFKKINWKDIPVATYVRYILMIISIVNMLLTRLGLNPISVSEDSLYQLVSDLITAGVFIANTWYNNSVTPEAIDADKYMNSLKTTRNTPVETETTESANDEEAAG